MALMMKGKSAQTVSSNIKQLMSTGKEPKQAIAMSIAHSRKYKKMYDGGFVEGEMEEGEPRSLGELQEDAEIHPGLGNEDNPMPFMSEGGMIEIGPKEPELPSSLTDEQKEAIARHLKSRRLTTRTS